MSRNRKEINMSKLVDYFKELEETKQERDFWKKTSEQLATMYNNVCFKHHETVNTIQFVIKQASEKIKEDLC